MTKPNIRSDMLAKRKAMRLDHPHAGPMAATHLPAKLLTTTGIVAGYNTMGSEIDAAPVLACLESAGWDVIYSHPDNETPVFLNAEGQVTYPDLIIAPLVAFDGNGNRLGRGGGWYDQAIVATREHKACRVIGLAYTAQQLDEIPAEAHDIPLDAILTEDGYVEFKTGR